MKLLKKVLPIIFMILLTCNIASAYGNQEILNIDLKTSKHMKLDRKITRIAVGNPEVATVLQVPNATDEFLIITHAPGSTSLFVWTAPNIMREYVVNVSPENIGMGKMIQQAIGLSGVRVRVVDNRILLTGTVRNQYERNWAVQTARLYSGGKGSDSGLSTGSGVDMSMTTQNAVTDGSVNVVSATVGGTTIQSQGEVIDLLHMIHPTQIRLEAQVIAIRPQDKQELGINYGNDPINSPGVFSISNEQGTSSFFRHDVWTRSAIGLSLSALVTQNRAKILSRPSITTMSGEAAVIQVGGEIPYTTYDANKGTKVEFKDYGIILQLKPVADVEDRITSTIHAEVSNMSGESVDGQPILNIRRADSVVTVHNGATMVIGGLMDSSETKIIKKFPLLGNIPIIGEFFKYTSKNKDKQELIILVTPYIVDDEEISRVKMSDSMQELYNSSLEEKNNLNDVDLNETSEDE